MSWHYKEGTKYASLIATITVIACIVGIAGDLCLLLYAYSNNTAFPSLVNMPASVLTLGAVLGCSAIFVYMLGSAWLIAYGLKASNLAKYYFIASLINAPLVMAGHAMTAMGVAACVPRGSTEIFSSCLLEYGGGKVVVVWLLLLLVSILMCYFLVTAIVREATLFPRYMALINPLVLVVGLSALATGFKEYAQPIIFIIPSFAFFLYTVLIFRIIKLEQRKAF